MATMNTKTTVMASNESYVITKDGIRMSYAEYREMIEAERI